MKRVIAFGIIIIVILYLALTSGSNVAPESARVIEPSEVDRSGLMITVPNVVLTLPNLSLPSLGNPLAEMAWQTFEKYQRSAGTHDLATLRTLSHQISETCNNPKLEEECFALMDNVYAIGSEFKQADFTNIWSNDKQIILATNYAEMGDASSGLRGLIRSVIYFTIVDSEPRVLSFNNFDGAFILSSGESEEEIRESLMGLVQSTDEEITRDTDGDGWWDSVEEFFYKQEE